MKITTIIFDAYGTLIDTANGSVCATKKILLKNQCSLEPAQFYREWKKRHGEIIKSLSVFRTEESVFEMSLLDLYTQYGIHGEAEKDVKLMLDTLGVRNAFSDTQSCLKLLRNKYELVIASNTDTEPFLSDLHRNQICVSRWFSSESLETYKPHRQFYECLLDKLGKSPEEIVFVGDSLEADVVGPRACGIKSVWLNRKGERNAEIRGIEEIASLAELPTLMQSVGETSGQVIRQRIP